MKAPVISAALAGAHRAEWCLRVPRCHGANPRHWPPDVIAAISRSQDIFLGRLDSGDPQRGAAKIGILAETTACIEFDAAWWCVVVWHYQMSEDRGRMSESACGLAVTPSDLRRPSSDLRSCGA